MSISTKLTRFGHRQKLRVKKNSPHIMFGCGLAGTVASTVLACRATLKADKMFDEMSDDIEMARSTGDKRDLAYVYFKNSARFTKAYAPALVVGGVSVALLTGSHVQLTRRNTTLTVAYAALHKAYGEYRDRVREEVGEERELDLYHGVTLEDVKNGKGDDRKKRKVIDPNKLSPYAMFFDEANPNWNPNAEFNRLFIQCQQNYHNQRLYAVGHVFLNEVYESLGMNKTRAGQVVGWVLNSEGDNFIDFGIFEAYNSDFVNGHEPSLVLDFNVDGPILDCLK